jgi:hypothetical protein
LIISSRFIETNVKITKTIGISRCQKVFLTFLPEFISTIKEFSIFIDPANIFVMKNCVGKIIQSTRKILKSFKKNVLIAIAVKSNRELKTTSCWSLSKNMSFDLRKFVSFIIKLLTYKRQFIINLGFLKQIFERFNTEILGIQN